MRFTKKIRLPKIAQHHPVAFSVAVILHIFVLIGLLFSDVQRLEKVEKSTIKKSIPRFIPKAVTIDLSEIKKEKRRLENIQKKKNAKIKREEKRLRILEDERYKKQKKINQLKNKEKKEKQAKKIAERKRKVAEREAKLAENKRRKAEEKAKIAEKKNKEIEKRRKAEAEKFKAEQEERKLAKQIQLKEDRERKTAQEGVMKELRANYIKQIASKVRGQWRYQGAKDNWGCEVYITQNTGGNVQQVDLKSCNIDDKSKVKSFKNSIKRAVNKASPLPAAPDKSVFDHKIIFHFRVN
ncbi:MAG: hypothetical protein Ctma_0416 [Catillopecten margaritatus gill symbiont]|uniref:Protein TolA n=1 Tax=Catillopecten margaritatus gill symbiont TaxID=3083288 RepID=A0AAU6PFD0_9GAMM